MQPNLSRKLPLLLHDPLEGGGLGLASRLEEHIHFKGIQKWSLIQLDS